MKEMNELEERLRSWMLRQPSAGVEQRIFAAAHAAGAKAEDGERARERPHFSFAWLVPATASLLLLGLIINPRASQSLSESTSSGPLVAMIMSNQSAAAYLPGSFKHDE